MFFKKLFIFVGMLMIFSLTACVSTFSLSRLTLLRSPENLSHEYNYKDTTENDYLEFKEKMNIFSSKIGSIVTKSQFSEGKNVTCAPISIELCLGLAISAANGQTRQELIDAIGVDYDTFNKYYKLYYNELLLYVEDDLRKIEASLSLSNSIWIDNDVSLYEKGLDDLQNNYYCYAYEADFDGNNKLANKAIREFVKKQTNGLIDQDMNIDPITMFVLMNTIYLKDIWNVHGDNLKYASSEYTFTNIDGSLSTNKLLDGYYFAGKAINIDNYRAFFTTTQHNFNIFFVVPNDNNKVNDIFSDDVISYVSNKSNYIYQDDELMEEYYTKCIFPEFKASCDLDIMAILQNNFGITKMFTDGECDFTNLTDNQYGCSGMKHIAKLEVNKKGIEGAAVTYIPKAGAVGPGPYEKVYETFEVNKEFGFILTFRDIILFTGIVTNID